MVTVCSIKSNQASASVSDKTFNLPCQGPAKDSTGTSASSSKSLVNRLRNYRPTLSSCSVNSLIGLTGFRRRGKGFAWQLLITHRRVVGEDGGHGGHLHHVFALHVINRIHIRMVRARIVFQTLLDELEPRQSDGVEGQVVGACDRTRADQFNTKVFKRLDPLREDRSHGQVAL